MRSSLARTLLQLLTSIIRRRAAAWPPLLLTVLSVGVYVTTLHAPLTFDDRTEVLENSSIERLGDVQTVLRYNVTRPLVNVSYAIDHAVTGLDPFAYHVTNVVLHTLNVLLLFLLARGIVRDVGARRGRPRGEDAAPLMAFAVAGLFAVHPMMTEAVTYVSGRAELLSATLFLASLLFLRAGLLGRGARFCAAGIACFAAALGAKETAVMLPFVLLAYDLLILDGRATAVLRPRRWLHATLIGGVAIAAAARVWVYVAVEHPDASGFQPSNILVSLDIAARYVSLLLVPSSQSVVHPVDRLTFAFGSLFELRVILAGAAWLMVVGLAVRLRRREPLLTFGAIWFVLLLLPSSMLILIATKGQPMAEHRVYLASPGFFIAVVAGIRALAASDGAVSPLQRARTLIGLMLVLAILSGLTLARNSLWNDSVALWEDAVRKAPRTYAAHYGLADAYRSIGDCQSAAERFQAAIRMRPQNPEPYLGLAACQEDLLRPDDARSTLRAGLQAASADAPLELALAALEEQRQNSSEALRLCRQALAENPRDGKAVACVERNASAAAR